MIAEPLASNLLQTLHEDRIAAPEQVRDFELLRRIAAKDEAALQELYAIHGQRLYAYAIRLTDDPALAEDVVQDALVAVWSLADSYRCEGRPIAWLMGIIHHIALKSLRHRADPLSEEVEVNLPAADPLPEEQAQTNQRAAWIRQKLQELSPEHRAVLELTFYQGLSLKETARVCQCPLGTVKSRLNYARLRLRGLLSRTEESQ